jgi:hypothetical protein
MKNQTANKLHEVAAVVFADCGQASVYEAVTAQTLVDLIADMHKAKLPVVQAAKAGAAPAGSEWEYYNTLATEKAGSNAMHVRALLGLFFNGKKVTAAGGRAMIVERLKGRNDGTTKYNRIADLPRIGKGKDVITKGASHKTDKPEGKKAIKGATMELDGLSMLIATIKQLETDGAPETLLKKFDGALKAAQVFYSAKDHKKAA